MSIDLKKCLIYTHEGGDVIALLKEIRAIIGKNKEIHVQVTEQDSLTIKTIADEKQFLVMQANAYEATRAHRRIILVFLI